MRCIGIGVEEGMAVSSAVIGGLAEFWVGDERDERVDSDNGALVACRAQFGAGGVDGLDDSFSGGLAAVYKLVADRNGSYD